jgi:hypothetical protein
MKKIFSVYITTLLMSLPVLAVAQTVDAETAIQRMIEERKFVFVANTAVPLRGMIIQQLNYPYDLRFSGDSLIAELPYFGRAFVAPMHPAEGGIRFISTENEYTVQQRKKGGWDISVKPSGRTDVRQMNLTVFVNGRASLRVTNNNRDPITFHGYIVEKR